VRLLTLLLGEGTTACVGLALVLVVVVVVVVFGGATTGLVEGVVVCVGIDLGEEVR